MFSKSVTRIRTTLIAMAAVMLPASLIAVPAASAQTCQQSIVVNQGKILKDAKGAQDIRAKLKTMAESTGQQLQPEGQSLESERNTIAALVQGKTEDQIKADAGLMTRINSFETRLNSYGERTNKNLRDLQYTEMMAWRDFATALEGVLQTVAQERGATCVQDAGSMLYFPPSADATDRVIQLIDQRTPSVNVVRRAAPTPAQ